MSIAAVNSIVSSRRAERQRQTEIETRQAQLFMHLYERFYDKDLWEGISEMARRVEEFLKDPDREPTQEEYNQFLAVGAFFEGLGILVKRGWIKTNVVNDLMPNTIMGYYETIEPIIKSQRENNNTYLYKGYEYLYNQVKKTIDQHYKEWDKYLTTE